MPVGGVVSNAISGVPVALVRAWVGFATDPKRSTAKDHAGARVGGFCWELSVSRKVCRHAGARVMGWPADTVRLGV